MIDPPRACSIPGFRFRYAMFKAAMFKAAMFEAATFEAVTCEAATSVLPKSTRKENW